MFLKHELEELFSNPNRGIDFPIGVPYDCGFVVGISQALGFC